MTTPDLHLGYTQNGEKLTIETAARKTDMHVLGGSGRGKSFFLEYLIRQDISEGNGLCLVDPSGTLYRRIVAWCAQEPGISRDKLVLLDASALGWAFGFNPLDSAGADISSSVDSMVSACAQVWDGEDTPSTPLLKRVLRGVFHALAERELTLLEFTYLIGERDDLKPLRAFITDNLNDPVIREDWNNWNALTTDEFRSLCVTAVHRLNEFTAAQAIRGIIGQRENIVDFRRLMDEGAFILVNLESRGRLSDLNARTLGTLILNDLFLKARDRPAGSPPFYLYVDECERYLNESIRRILDESSRRSFHLILANQHFSQLREAGDTVYRAIMTYAQTKVVFGGLATEDTHTMVTEVLLNLDLGEPMQAAPAASTWGFTDSQSSRELYSVSESVRERFSETVTEMNSWMERFNDITVDSGSGRFALEEQRYHMSAWLKKQPQQMALLVQSDASLIPFRIPTVRSLATTGEAVDRFVEERYEALPFVSREKLALEHIETRARELEREASRTPREHDQPFEWYDNE